MSANLTPWWEDLARRLSAGLETPCSYEYPGFINVDLGRDVWIALGDANETIGFHAADSLGEVGPAEETNWRAGDPIADVAFDLVTRLRIAIARLEGV